MANFQNRISALTIFVTAFVVRIGYFFWKGPILYGDSYDYLSLGESLVKFQTYGFLATNGEPSAFRPPFYSFVVAPFLIFDKSEWAIATFQCLLGAATVFLVYKISSEYFSPSVGLIAAFLLTFEPFTIHFSTIIMSETLFTFLIVAGSFLFLRKRFMPSGLIFGLAVLTKPIVMPVLLATLALSIILRDRKLAKGTFVSLVLMISIMSLWTIRNAFAFHEFIPISSTGYGYNLLCGTIDVPMLNDEGWLQVKEDPAVKLRRKRISEGWTESEADRAILVEAVQRISTNPKAWIKVRAKQYTRLYIDSAPYLLGHSNIPFSEAV